MVNKKETQNNTGFDTDSEKMGYGIGKEARKLAKELFYDVSSFISGILSDRNLAERTLLR